MKNLFTLFIFCFSFAYSSGQCVENRHSTNWYDGWLSCERAANPNPNRLHSHWILYDLKGLYRLNRSHIWNYNDVNALENGSRRIAVDYSEDGTNWSTLGTYNLNQANGSPLYSGEEGPDFNGVVARYVLITSTANFTGDCHGLGELKIEADELSVSTENPELTYSCLSVNVFPNPIKTDGRVYVQSDCKGEISYRLYDIQGRLLKMGEVTDEILQSGYIEFNSLEVSSGEYIIEVGNDETSIRKNLIKL